MDQMEDSIAKLSQGRKNRVHTITKKHYIPESTLIDQKALRKHMKKEGSVCPVNYYFMCFDNKDVYMWQERVYNPET